MKRLLSVLICLTNAVIMTPQAYGLTSSESFCGDSASTIAYQVSNNLARLFVRKAPSTIGGNIINSPQIPLENFKIELIEENEFESSFSSTCDQVDNVAAKGVKTLKNLSFKKVRITHEVEGESLPEGILGLSKNGMEINVDYLCTEFIHNEVACE
jgi:hypothetical protein